MSYTLYYHTSCTGFYGRAWAPYTMLSHAGIGFENKAPDACPAGGGFAPPMMTFPGGFTVGQTNALTQLVGKDCGLAPVEAAHDAKAQQVVADAGDFLTELMSGKPAERLNKWLAHLASLVGEEGFLAGPTLSYADFGLYPVLSVFDAKAAAGKLPEGVEVPEKLRTWQAMIGDVPEVKTMDATGIPVLPPAYI